MTERTATISRKTNETDITLTVNIDGEGKAAIATGIGFFDHMLTLLARHSLIDLNVAATGDTDVDLHHTVEDVGICLGQALARALGDKRGIVRYGFFILPMDECLARVALDFSGRPCLEWRAEITAPKCGDFDTCLGKEFARALSSGAGMNLHVDLLAEGDPHHSLEAIFKALGRSIRMAAAIDPREKGVPSSKGVL